MKKTLSFTTLLIVTNLCFSQHISTSATPTSGNIYHESGRLGIGTTSPIEDLHVQGHDILLIHPENKTSLQFRVDSNNSYISNKNGFMGNGSTANNNLAIIGQKNITFHTGTAPGNAGPLKMIIQEGGNVGIGTLTPSAKLEIQDGRLKINSVAPILHLRESDNTKDWFMVADGNTFSIRENNTGTQRISITNGGRVGIGATAPDAKLSIDAGAVGEPLLALNHTFGNYSNDPEQNRPLTLRRNTGNNESMNMYVQDAATFFTYRNDEALSTVHFRMINTDTESGGGANANDNNVMSIVGNNNGGGVGIGTDNPGDWRLAVNGNIRAHEIVVETGWSDFVFESDYKLSTLEEVEQHIKTKGHLKDIPNAKEVEENGIQLGEMNSKLLQKIEELTLYLIEQHKLNQIQKTQHKTLQQQLNAQQKDIAALKAINNKLLQQLKN